MITLQRNQQKMKYALQGAEIPIYDYYEDEDGNKIPIETGETKQGYFGPVSFLANINNKLSEVTIQEFGVDNSTKYSQIVSAKGALPFEVGTVIWKDSEVIYEDTEETLPDSTSADYKVMGVAKEGLNYDLYLLQKNV